MAASVLSNGRRKVFFAVAIVVVLVVAAFALNAVLEMTGAFKGRCTCTDSDGRNYFVKGSAYTSCAGATPSPASTDYCVSASTVKEYYCRQGKSNVFSESVSCSYGCVNGACLASPQTTTTTSTTTTTTRTSTTTSTTSTTTTSTTSSTTTTLPPTSTTTTTSSTTTTTQSAGKTYYISSSGGSDSNDGLSAPWKSLDKIFVKSFSSTPFAAGDRILLKRGDAWDGQIRIKASGTAANPMTLGAYGSGAKPIIYGDSSTLAWTPVAGHPSIFSAAVGEGSIISPAYQGATKLSAVSAAGLNLANAADLETFLGKFTPGSFGPYTTTKTLWVRTTDDQPHSDIRAFRTSVIYVTNPSSYLTIENLDIRRGFHGIDSEGSNQITVRNNDVQDVLDIGIYLRWGNTNCLVENNSVTRAGNTALYVLTGSHNTFRKNSVYNVTNNILGITVAADQCGMGLQESADNLVEYNNFSFIKNSGVDYYYENRSTVRYNYFYHLNAGGAYPHGTNLSIYGNIFNLDNAEIGMNADPIWQGKILVYDNVFYGTKSLGLMVTSSIGAVTFRNNIVFGGTSGILLTDFDSKTDSDYNCFYAIGSASFRKNGVSYSSLSAFQIATGSDVHSIYSDPQFVSSTPLVAGDFKLKSASLCINAGADLKAQGIIPQSQELRDYAGTIIPQGAGYDIGAFEYAG